MVSAMQVNRTLFGHKLRQLSDMFEAIDKDETKSITCDDLWQATKRLGVPMSQKGIQVSSRLLFCSHTDGRLQDLFDGLDENHSGHISVAEFCDTLQMHASEFR